MNLNTDPYLKLNSTFSWQRLFKQSEGLMSVSSQRVSNAANLSALLFLEVPDISWVGFYFLQAESLWLGPFQGKPACVEIEMGKAFVAAQRLAEKLCW